MTFREEIHVGIYLRMFQTEGAAYEQSRGRVQGHTPPVPAELEPLPFLLHFGLKTALRWNHQLGDGERCAVEGRRSAAGSSAGVIMAALIVVLCTQDTFRKRERRPAFSHVGLSQPKHREIVARGAVKSESEPGCRVTSSYAAILG